MYVYFGYLVDLVFQFERLDCRVDFGRANVSYCRLFSILRSTVPSRTNAKDLFDPSDTDEAMALMSCSTSS